MKLTTIITLTIVLAIIFAAFSIVKQDEKRVQTQTLAAEIQRYCMFVPAPGHEFLKANIDKAIFSSRMSGVPVAIILGVAMHESDLGRSPVATTLNNHFGIRNSQSSYKKYESVDAGYVAFGRLMNSCRYDIQVDDLNTLINKIQKSGYAKDPDWADKVIRLINDYRLYVIDEMIQESASI